jgi:hypothetical protein
MKSIRRKFGLTSLVSCGLLCSAGCDFATKHEVEITVPIKYDLTGQSLAREDKEKDLNKIHTLEEEIAKLRASAPGAPPPPAIVRTYRPRFLSTALGCPSRVEFLGGDRFRFSNVEGYSVVFSFDRNSRLFTGENGTRASYFDDSGLIVFSDAGQWVPHE